MEETQRRWDEHPDLALARQDGLRGICCIALRGAPDAQLDALARMGAFCTYREGEDAALLYAQDEGVWSIEKLTNALKSLGLQAGLSGPFALAASARGCMLKAQLALETGLAVAPGRTVYPMGEFGEAALLRAARQALARQGFVPGDFLHEALGRMVRMDAQRDTQYLRSLDAYLGCGRDMKRAAQALGVHRNTLDYRLSRIGELFALDLGDMNTCFELLFSLWLMKNLPAQAEAPADAPFDAAEDQLAELARYFVLREEPLLHRDDEVASLGQHCFAVVDEDARSAPEQFQRQLPLVRRVGAHACDVAARLDVRGVEDRLCGRRHRRYHVGTDHGLFWSFGRHQLCAEFIGERLHLRSKVFRAPIQCVVDAHLFEPASRHQRLKLRRSLPARAEESPSRRVRVGEQIRGGPGDRRGTQLCQRRAVEYRADEARRAVDDRHRGRNDRKPLLPVAEEAGDHLDAASVQPAADVGRHEHDLAALRLVVEVDAQRHGRLALRVQHERLLVRLDGVPHRENLQNVFSCQYKHH